MDIETRVKNLEDMLASFANTVSNNKFYTDADVNGVRKSVSDITPYTETKTAYIDDTEVVFENVPSGNISITWDKPDFATDSAIFRRDGNTVVIEFAPLEEVKQVTISII